MAIPRWLTASRYPQGWILGTGIDGALSFDGTATVLGLSPVTVGSFKVYTLTRDIYPSSITIGSNVIIFEANFRIFCKGAITGAGSSVSLIHNNGNDCPTATSSGPGQGASTPTGTYAATKPGNASGASAGTPPLPFGATTTGGAGGTQSTGVANPGGTPSGLFAGGGGGGVAQTGGTGQNGSAGFNSTAISTVGAGYDPIAQMFGFIPLGATTQFTYGAGGNQGGIVAIGTGGSTLSQPGGGGAGGGCCFVSAASITNVGLSANGGAGGQGFLGTQGTTGAAVGGGGGGGGGILVVHYGTQSGCTFTANGGTGAIGLSRGTGIAASGGNGGAGRVLLYSGDGT